MAVSMLVERLNEMENAEIVRQCAWCHAVLIGQEWIQIGYGGNVQHIEQSIAGLPARHRVSHGICPACASRLRAEER